MKKHQLKAKLLYQRNGYTSPKLLTSEEIDYLLKLMSQNRFEDEPCEK